MLFKNRGKKTEPALGAANENAVAAVNENEIATGENNFDSSSVAAQSRRQKAFRILRQSPVRFAVCFGQCFYFGLFVDVLVIQSKPLLFTGTFFTVLSVVAAVKSNRRNKACPFRFMSFPAFPYCLSV